MEGIPARASSLEPQGSWDADILAWTKEGSMFLILAVVLVLLWLGGFFLFHVTSFFIHLLLIFAVISVIMHFVSGRRAV